MVQMPCRGILSLGFSICVLSWHFAPAWADTDEKAKAYAHFSFIAEQIQDQLPLPASKRGQRPINEIKKTKFTARIDMYFVPGDVTAPAFARARYNVRGQNHHWQDTDTGFQAITFRTSEFYQAINDGVTRVSDLRGPLAPGVLDYTETPMPKGTLIASAMEIKGGLRDFLSKVELLQDESSPQQTSPLVLEMHIAVPEQEFMKQGSEFKTQARLSFEYYDSVNRAQSIFYRKMHYGTARTAALNEAEAAELSRLLSLHDHSCESNVEDHSDQTKH
jgi:hypothetical protein